MFRKTELNELRKEFEEKYRKLENRQMDFLLKAHEVIKSVQDNDKKKFVYAIREEEHELMLDGEKYREIRKIIE